MQSDRASINYEGGQVLPSLSLVVPGQVTALSSISLTSLPTLFEVRLAAKNQIELEVNVIKNTTKIFKTIVEFIARFSLSFSWLIKGKASWPIAFCGVYNFNLHISIIGELPKAFSSIGGSGFGSVASLATIRAVHCLAHRSGHRLLQISATH